MKKVVERVERENEQLKKAPGVVSNQIMDELRAENQLLKVRTGSAVDCTLIDVLFAISFDYRFAHFRTVSMKWHNK